MNSFYFNDLSNVWIIFLSDFSKSARMAAPSIFIFLLCLSPIYGEHIDDPSYSITPINMTLPLPLDKVPSGFEIVPLTERYEEFDKYKGEDQIIIREPKPKLPVRPRPRPKPSRPARPTRRPRSTTPRCQKTRTTPGRRKTTPGRRKTTPRNKRDEDDKGVTVAGLWNSVAPVAAAAVAATAYHNRMTTVEQYPSVVQVDFLLPNIGWDQICAGTILTSVVVVSAARCFHENVAAESRRIRAGSSIRNSGGTIVGLRSYRNHPKFNIPVHFDADISLLYLAQELVFSASVQPASISPKVHLPGGSSVTLATWGRRVPDQDFMLVLREGTVTTVSFVECNRYSKDIMPEHICFGILGRHLEADCWGGTGGPMYHDGLLVGVVVFSRTCSYAFSGAGTLVSAYEHWILDNINDPV